MGFALLDRDHDGSFAHPDVYHFLFLYHSVSVYPAKFELVGADHVFGLLQPENDELHVCCQASLPHQCLQNVSSVMKNEHHLCALVDFLALPLSSWPKSFLLG